MPQRAWTESSRWKQVAGVGLALGLALPAHGEAETAEDPAPLEVSVQPDRNDAVFVLSNGIPPLELRIRQPAVRTLESLHGIGSFADPSAIPTRGAESTAVDVISHRTQDYGAATAIRTRGAPGPRVFQPIRTHRVGDPPDGPEIRYHGSFR